MTAWQKATLQYFPGCEIPSLSLMTLRHGMLLTGYLHGDAAHTGAHIALSGVHCAHRHNWACSFQLEVVAWHGRLVRHSSSPSLECLLGATLQGKP